MRFKALCKGHVFTCSVTRTMPCWLSPQPGMKKLLWTMKFTIVVLLSACLSASAHGYAQSVSFSGRNVMLKEVFTAIERQTPYVFFYDADLLDGTRKVSIDLKDVTVERLLEACLKDQPLEFVIRQQTVFITRKVIEKKAALAESPLPPDIRGRVVNEAGDPVEGVSVKIKGSNNGASTDVNGVFLLKGIDGPVVLVFSSTNIEEQEIRTGSRNDLVVRVKTKVSKLDEVQIVAYGTTTQRYNVGSVSKVTSEEIAQQPVQNPLAALEGRVPGLVVTQTSGVPGAAFKIQVRGQNTLFAGAFSRPMDNPLIIVDGVPFAPQNKNLNQFGSLATKNSIVIDNDALNGISPFNSINPSDIESIEVLRDADATAIYGSRGANGVVLITTKKGKPGKVKFDMNVYGGGSRVTRTMKMMNTQQYLAMRREAIDNDGLTSYLTDPAYAVYFPDLVVYDTAKYTDWKKYFMGNTARTTDVYASLSGGATGTRFMVSAGYHRETFIFPGDFSDKHVSTNMNLHHNTADGKLVIDFSAGYSFGQNNSAGSADALQAFTLSPNFPDLIDANGNLVWNYKGIPLDNPMGYLKQKYLLQSYNLLSHFQIGYEVLPGLQVRSSFGYNTLNSTENSQVPISARDPARFSTGAASFGTNNFQTWIIEPQAEYTRRIAKGKLTVLAGGTFQQNINASTAAEGENYNNDALLGSLSAAGSKTMSDANSLYRYSAVFGRINYIWDRRYILNLSGRRDGSSRFGPGRQFGNFGSADLGWIFSEEQWIKQRISPLSYGKLRASYGTTGGDVIGDYQFTANWQPTNRAYQDALGYIPMNLYKPNFSWTVNKKLEAGVELGFLGDRLLANISWYRNRCGNQLVSYDLPTQTGFGSVTLNWPALVQNSGWEVQISTTNIKTRKFKWTTALNLTLPKNKLLSFPGIEISSYSYAYIVGQPLNILKKYRLAGVNDTTGIYQFYTKKGGISYTPMSDSDYYVIGNRDPQFYGGFRNVFNYEGFQLDLFFQFTKQKGFNYLQSTLGWAGTPVNRPVDVLSRWQKPGDHTHIQRFGATSITPAYDASNRYFSNSDGAFEDASFIRLKTLSLSYSFQPGYLKKVKLSGCRIYFNAQNLVTLTHYKGSDPESQSFYSVPPMKTFVGGIQFNF